jgi:ABC-type uncharacterized transport system substrate-binding protein
MAITKFWWRAIVALAFIAAVLLTNFYHSGKPVIAVIYSPDVYYHSRAGEFVMQWCRENMPEYAVREFCPLKHRDNTSLRFACRAALERCYQAPGSICVSICLSNTRMLVAQARRLQQETPIVFVGVDDADKHGFVDSLEKPGGHVTGVVSAQQGLVSYAKLISLLIPDARRVLMPYYYSPHDLHEEEGYQETRIEAESLGLSVEGCPIDTESLALQILRHKIPQYDAILIPEYSHLVAQTAGVAKIADRYEVPFIDGQIHNRTAAPFVFGIDPSVPARAACDLVQRISKGASPAECSVVKAFGARRLSINIKMCEQCGIGQEAIECILARIDNEECFMPLRGCVDILEML